MVPPTSVHSSKKKAPVGLPVVWPGTAFATRLALLSVELAVPVIAIA